MDIPPVLVPVHLEWEAIVAPARKVDYLAGWKLDYFSDLFSLARQSSSTTHFRSSLSETPRRTENRFPSVVQLAGVFPPSPLYWYSGDDFVLKCATVESQDFTDQLIVQWSPHGLFRFLSSTSKPFPLGMARVLGMALTLAFNMVFHGWLVTT